MITKIVTWAALYLMIWWVTLFAVLPLGGNVSHHEAGAPVEKGNDPGAPIKLDLGRKMRLNTLVAFVLWAIVMVFMLFVHVPLPEIR
ncbi:MAG TPA: DUF1467 family protein [Asticcacaulis sp.]|jgi:predicted secreted protein|nr:DUF1467 family protein [Asticcacaulis sp.]